ncbi:MAG: hypothetical protein AAFP19_00070 [Bacteroidota bacterium]
MSTNHLSDREREIMLCLLEDISKKRKISESKIINTYLEQGEIANWNRIKNRLTQVIKRYFLIQEIEQGPRYRDSLLLGYFQKEGLTKNYMALDSKIRKDRYPKDEKTSLFNFWNAEIGINSRKELRKKDHFLSEMDQQLDDFYLENKLRLLCEQINRSYIINSEVHFTSLPDYLKDRIEASSSEGIALYYEIYKMLTAEHSSSHFWKVDQLIANSSFSKAYKKEVYDRLMNYCVRQINLGQISFAKQYIKYIDQLANLKLFIQANRISALRFKNCITVGVIADDQKWLTRFIAENANYLDAETKPAVLSFNQAFILFYQGNTTASHDLLKAFKPFDIYYKIAHDLLLLKIQYLQLLSGSFLAMNFKTRIESVKKYIRQQDRLRPERKKQVINFLNILAKLRTNKAIDLHADHLAIIDYLWLVRIVEQKK